MDNRVNKYLNSTWTNQNQKVEGKECWINGAMDRAQANATCRIVETFLINAPEAHLIQLADDPILHYSFSIVMLYQERHNDRKRRNK